MGRIADTVIQLKVVIVFTLLYGLLAVTDCSGASQRSSFMESEVAALRDVGHNHEMNTNPKTVSDGDFFIENSPTQHAFIMAGTQTLFLTHMTMMSIEAHSYQLVIRASIPAPCMAMYVADAQSHPNSTYFLGNAHYDLMSLPEIASGARREFLAVLYRDIPNRKVFHCWPWKEEIPLIQTVPVTVERVVFYRHFDFNLNPPTNLSYFLFGRGNEAHVTNLQIKEPAFDHIATLASAPEWLSPRLLESGIPIEVLRRPGSAVYCRPPFRTGEVRVRYAGRGPERRIVTRRHLWFATHIVNSVDPCTNGTQAFSEGDKYWDDELT
jgi:hypothetical protein